MNNSKRFRAAVGAGAILISGLAACSSGGGSSPTPVAIVTNSPTGTPTGTPTNVPTQGPTNSPTQTPTASPTGNTVQGAPATVVSASGFIRGMGTIVDSSGRRKAQVNLGNGGVPTVVVGYSATMGATQAQLYAWAANAQSTPIPQATMAATATGPMTIQALNPDNVNPFASTLFDWILNPGPLTGTGKIAVNIVFPSASGAIHYFAYDKSNLDCGGTPSAATPTQWQYAGGIPVGAPTPPAVAPPADVSVTCTTPQSLNFTNGAMLLDPPLADAYGNLASQMTTVTTMGTFTNNVSTVQLSALQIGAIYIAKLGDGGFAKLMVVQNPLPFSSASLILFSLHDVPSGSGTFPF